MGSLHLVKIKGVLYYELLKPSEIVIADCYQCQLICLSHELERKRSYTGKGEHPVKLLHDNARLHIASSTKYIIMGLGWDVLQHSAHSPNIAPSDYHLFRSIQHVYSICTSNQWMRPQNGLTTLSCPKM